MSSMSFMIHDSSWFYAWSCAWPMAIQWALQPCQPCQPRASRHEFHPACITKSGPRRLGISWDLQRGHWLRCWDGRGWCRCSRFLLWLVVWLPFFEFSHDYWVSNHPNWLSYFSKGWANHQPDQILINVILLPSSPHCLILPPFPDRGPEIGSSSAEPCPVKPFFFGCVKTITDVSLFWPTGIKSFFFSGRLTRLMQLYWNTSAIFINNM